MNTIHSTSHRIGLGVAAALIAATSAAVAAPAAYASASRVPQCNSATTYDGRTMPGVGGKRTPCFIPYGAHGKTVAVLQRYLNLSRNPHVAVDGSFGPATKKAVSQFQHDFNTYPGCGQFTPKLAVDGSWGPITSKAAQNYLSCG